MADKHNKTETETHVPAAKSLAEESGVDQAAAARAIADMHARFEAQAAETRKLQELVMAQQAQISKLSGGSRKSSVEIIRRNCNVCGKDAGENGRCPNPKHKRAKVNEIGFGQKHAGRPQVLFVVKQV